MSEEPLAHSSRAPSIPAQTYQAHIAGTVHSDGVVNGARWRARAAVEHHRNKPLAEAIFRAVIDAATYHDLGKLDPCVQAALRSGREAKLSWDHIDAGVAQLRANGAHMAAWIVRAHHAPGLPSAPRHFTTTGDRRLRGRRNDTEPPERHQEQIDRTDRYLPAMLAAHEGAVGKHEPNRSKAVHGLGMRIGLSCLVDADHSDTAWADTGWTTPRPPQPRWAERLAALDAYVGKLGNGAGLRDNLRREFYQACRSRKADEGLIACEGPVGIGKTTAVTAYLLRRALASGARRLFIVAPFTAILSQTAERLREALLLEGERDRPEMIVAEHHHRADFGDLSSRDLATLWIAPIILTTAVQFFETLCSNAPSSLRKLHALPGSVIFLDEAHAALPTQLWPQNWRWVRELAEEWSCSFVLASGSLARFWEVDDIVEEARLKLPDLVPVDLAKPLRKAEAARVRYVTAGRLDGPAGLAKLVFAAHGPRLLVMNTVQSAAVVARLMRQAGRDVLHLSTALAPRDRQAIFQIVKDRLNPQARCARDWTLVATSLMEAGVDLSFRTSFRERSGTTSLIQIGGRSNRNFELSEGVTIYDFVVSHVDGLKAHPAVVVSADILGDLFKNGVFKEEFSPAEIVTLAMRREVNRRRQIGPNALLTAERERRYPEVAELGRVIDTDSRLVVVDRDLRDRIVARDRISSKELLAGTVQIWASKIRLLGLESLPGRAEIYWWPHTYDAAFLGYMEGALHVADVAKGDAIIY